MGLHKLLFICFLILIVTFSCKKNEDNSLKSVVINELMPVNSTIVADQNGEYDDWFELFNLTDAIIDLSGYYLSDSRKNPVKWQIPSGTSIHGNGYLIFWADKDTTQVGLHTNFKLSSLGEHLILSDPDMTIIDEVDYPAQTLELSYSRRPNGTGSFLWQAPTFNMTNDNPK